MSNVLYEQQEHVFIITLNRINKGNAFDDDFLIELQELLDQAQYHPEARVILLKANGRHFSAGADVAWMQRMVHLSEEGNLADAKILARLMWSLYQCKIPTIAMVQGAAMGGGAGLVAACDIAMAANSARFCFSEVTLGLIPAVISPYVIKAIGERAATGLFMSAETFDAKRAFELQLVQHCVPDEDLLSYTLRFAHQMAQWSPEAVRAAKSLARQVASLPITDDLQEITARLIAKQRVSIEGQRGLQAFLDKMTEKNKPSE
jgi:methylglutaconyl-CoA hydratase